MGLSLLAEPVGSAAWSAPAPSRPAAAGVVDLRESRQLRLALPLHVCVLSDLHILPEDVSSVFSVCGGLARPETPPGGPGLTPSTKFSHRIVGFIGASGIVSQHPGRSGSLGSVTADTCGSLLLWKPSRTPSSLSSAGGGAPAAACPPPPTPRHPHSPPRLPITSPASQPSSAGVVHLLSLTIELSVASLSSEPGVLWIRTLGNQVYLNS